MMRFDSAASSFLALLVNKSHRKTEKVQNLKEKSPDFEVKNVQNQFLPLEFSHATHLEVSNVTHL